MNDDKQLELKRYDDHARTLLSHTSDQPRWGLDGPESVALPYRAPYIAYAEALRRHAAGGKTVLEIGGGTGAFTGILLRVPGAKVCASDISPASLQLLAERYAGTGHLETKVADMEELPFDDGTFDVVASAGALSYGDNNAVLSEINRVLKPGGVFVCVDSLHHHPVYRLNRWLGFLRGKRTRSTLRRMPTMGLIKLYGSHFLTVEVKYFGAASWAMPLLVRTLGGARATSFSDYVDRLVNVSRSAFKFVMVAKKAQQ